jgi:alkylation response protein AidB-like acyl-CoA dehydrogenase
MNLLYTDVEEELRAGVRQVLTDFVAPSGAKLWRTLAVEMGLAGLAVPEELGGAGASWREVAVVQEELGRAAAEAPYLGSAVMATAALQACGDTSLLPALAAGERTAALAVPFSTAPGSAARLLAEPAVDNSAGGLLGAVTSVADALAVDVLLVLSNGTLCAVDAADAVRTRVVSLDETRPLCDVRLDGVPGRTLAAGVEAERAVEAALLSGAALLAAEQLGVAQWCLDSTVDYVKQRHQFGRPVGSFQAVKHRLADLWVEVSQARAVARYAAGCLAEGDADLPVAVALAKAHCSEVVVRAAQECVQLHGGIGFTWEHPAHRYLKRAKSTELALGAPDSHRTALATLVNLPHPVSR